MRDAHSIIVSLIKKSKKRLLNLYFPNDDGPHAGLLINRLVAHEKVFGDFEFTVTVLSDDAEIELTEVQGRMVCVELQREDHTSRFFNGYCFQFSLQRIESGVAVYEMVLTPWLRLFALRRNHALFHNSNITSQTKEIFTNSGLAKHEFRIRETDPERTFSCQYDESDFNYLHRRWEDMGWHYWYEHMQDGHCLVLSDTSPFADQIDGKPSIAYHHTGGSNLLDKITHWSPQRQLVSGKVALSSFDFKTPTPQQVMEISANAQGDVYGHEVYQYQDLYGFKEPEHGAQIAQLRMEQIDAESQRFLAKGNARAIQAGRWFRLNKEFDGNLFASSQPTEFFILSVTHIADNNFLNGDGKEAQYENEFTCIPRKTPWRPALGLVSQPVSIPGIDTAIVVGPEGENIYTDQFGRIKVQFHWDRAGKNNQASSAWLRVASMWAGAELGAMALPRIGSEVLVQWLGGSPDRPIVTGSVYNARNMPPWKLASQQNLMGLRSRELKPGAGNAAMGRSNHVILDDTPAKIQVQIKSDHQHSQLSLGHITRIESNAGRKDARGEGWELATNAWGVARAAKGMLLTTEGRKDAVSHIKDMAETVQRLADAREQHAELAVKAEKYQALENPSQQNAVAGAIKSQNEAIQSGATGGFPELSAPHLVLASPAGIETTSGQSTHIASEQHTALTAGKNLSFSSGDSLYASIRNTLRLFVHKAGMKMVAAAGDIDIRALTDSVNILANLHITQVGQRISITAKDEVFISGGGSYVKFTASGIEHGTTGSHVFHAKNHSFIGPNKINFKFPVMPTCPIVPQPQRKLDSSFAHDQLTGFAKRGKKAEFIAMLVPIFGYDLPASTYIKLYEGLRSGSIPNPKIVVMSAGHYPAAFDNKTREILVHRAAAERAAKDKAKAWELLTALLHEYGHYIDCVLRQDLADKAAGVADDAPGDEGAKFAYEIAGLELGATSHVVFAKYTAPEYSGDLEVRYDEVQKLIREAQAEEAQHKEGKDGTQEHFGSGDGEHAKERPNESFGHRSIEQVLPKVDRIFEGDMTTRQIYFGNWLRDFSQVLDPKVIRPPQAPKFLSKHMSRKAWTDIINVLAEEEFVKHPSEKPIFKVTPKLLGVYKATEHIDNPNNNDPNAPDPRSVDPDFEPPASKAMIAVDPATSMKAYIAASVAFMKKELNMAATLGNNADGRRHFGSGLHVLEDYFSHSNFLELSLRKIGHSKVLPWTSPAGGKHALPVVTGMFNSEDVIASTAGLLADGLFKSKWEFEAKKSGERTKADRIILIVLSEHEDPWWLKAYQELLAARDQFLKMPGNIYLQQAMYYTLGQVMNVTNFVFNSLLHLLGNTVDDAQVYLVGDPNTNGSTNPSHSQLAKDHDNHPFHTLAASLAMHAVGKVGAAMAAKWAGNPAADPAAVAAAFIVHPFDSTWQDKLVTDWAAAHPKELIRGESSTEWIALEKAHGKEVRERIGKTNEAAKKTWDYININYETIFGEKNQVKK